jgi:hypothetical protein
MKKIQQKSKTIQDRVYTRQNTKCSKLISPSTHNASTAAMEKVVAWWAFVSSVDEGTGSGNDVDGSSDPSSSQSKPYSSSSIKMLSSISLSLAQSKTSRGPWAVSLKVTSYDSITVLVLRLNTL